MPDSATQQSKNPAQPTSSIAIYNPSEKTSNRVGVKADERANPKTNDHFMQRDGMTFAGTHLLLDLWQASQLDDLDIMDKALREAAAIAGATLLHLHLHHFTSSGGISGVAVLAESHISVHSWPERNFAAFDIFMCGDTQPEKAIDVIRSYFKPARLDITDVQRGLQKSKP